MLFYRTWKYVEQEIPKIPAHIPVVILANCRDMGLHRTVDVDTPGYFVSSLDRLVGVMQSLSNDWCLIQALKC